MNQSTPVGPAKSIKVYPGDKVSMQVTGYYENNSGYGSSNTAAAMITAIAGAFGGSVVGAGESLQIYNGVSSGITGFGLGSNPGDGSPAAFINYILYDQNYKVMTMGWSRIPATPATQHTMSITNIPVKEAGYMFVYLSYENESNNYVYFDDFKVTHTPGNLIQGNEYYPFGMQTLNSWTRENTLGNNYLGNGGTEVNSLSKLYDLDYRNYDAALGVLRQVDPMVDKYAALSPYSFAANDPANLNDPSGADYDQDYDVTTGHSRRVDMMWNWLQVINGGGGGGLSVMNMSMWGYTSDWRERTNGFSPMYNDGQLVNSGQMSIEQYARKWGVSTSDPSLIKELIVMLKGFYNPQQPENMIASTDKYAGLYYEDVTQSDPQQDDRPDLGRVGNAYRSGLKTDFQKSLFEQYWLGSGKDYKLSKTQFNDIVATAFLLGRFRTMAETTLNGEKVIGVTVGFYNSEEYARALGTATFYIDYQGNPVGFRDDYDFNPLP